MIHKHLSSPQNPLIKQAIQLKHKARERKSSRQFLAEGLRETRLALLNGYHAQSLFYDPDQTPRETIDRLVNQATVQPSEIVTVPAPVFEKIAYRSGVPNVVGIFHQKEADLGNPAALPLPENPLILILEGIEKPGNFGAILRTADAAGIDAVWLCEPDFDLFNPNAIRASLGAIFTVPILEPTSTDAVKFLKSRNIPLFVTWLEAAVSLYDCNLTGPATLVLGAEATGITPFWVEQADTRMIIPMQGQVDSLNVASSAAIVLFEAIRQRRHA